MSAEAADLIDKLLAPNPLDRLGYGPPGSKNDFNALKNHSFFKGVMRFITFLLEVTELIIILIFIIIDRCTSRNYILFSFLFDLKLFFYICVTNIFYNLGFSKITYFNMILRIKKNIIRFQVSM